MSFSTASTASTASATQSHFVTVKGQSMHYVTAGTKGRGRPVVFVHGMPTSSYLWRHIMPGVATDAWCIAVDLIGMGKSARPKDIKYTVDDHIDYFAGFINALDLTDIILVVHGWGSVIGLSYAHKHAQHIAGIAMLESYLQLPKSLAELPLPLQEVLKATNVPDAKQKEKVIMDENYLVEKLLPAVTLKKLTQEDYAVYREPFLERENRRVLLQFIRDQPFLNPEGRARILIKNYVEWLQHTPLPKLLMYAVPGFVTSMSTVAWAIDSMPNFTVVELGQGLHYLPETLPQEIAQTLTGWLKEAI